MHYAYTILHVNYVSEIIFEYVNLIIYLLWLVALESLVHELWKFIWYKRPVEAEILFWATRER